MGIGIGYSHLPGEHVWMCTGGDLVAIQRKPISRVLPPTTFEPRIPHPENPKLFFPPPQKWEIQ